MSKIYPLISAPGQSAKIAMKSMTKMSEVARPNIPTVAKSDIESKACSAFDLSTEELGFFTYKGKVIDVKFPR